MEMAFSVKIKAEEREGYGNSRKQKKDSMASGILFSSAIGLSGRDNLIGVSKGIKTLMDSVMQVVLSANREWLAKRKGEDLEMCEALRELMADEIKAELTKAEALGTAIGETQGRIKGKLELLYSFVKRNDWTLKQAAKELNMTEEQFMEQVHSFGLDK